MSLVDPGLRRLAMSWEEYLALPEKPKAEWVDGEVVVSPPVSADHGETVIGLGLLFRTQLPRLRTMTEVGLWLSRNRLRAPDLMVLAHRPAEAFVTDTPVLVVEVLSPSTRSEDLVRKAGEYARAGIGQYWIVDPDHRSLEIYENIDGGWDRVLAHLDDAHPTGEVVVGEHGTVALDLREILPPPPGDDQTP